GSVVKKKKKGVVLQVLPVLPVLVDVPPAKMEWLVHVGSAAFSARHKLASFKNLCCPLTSARWSRRQRMWTAPFRRTIRFGKPETCARQSPFMLKVGSPPRVRLA